MDGDVLRCTNPNRITVVIIWSIMRNKCLAKEAKIACVSYSGELNG